MHVCHSHAYAPRPRLPDKMAATCELTEVIAEDNESLIESGGESTSVTVADTKVFSIDDTVESLGFGAFHILIVVYCGLGWVCV